MGLQIPTSHPQSSFGNVGGQGTEQPLATTGPRHWSHSNASSSSGHPFKAWKLGHYIEALGHH